MTPKDDWAFVGDPPMIRPEAQVVKRLGLPRDKVRCYVLIAFDPRETVDDAREHLTEVYRVGCLPFAQLYQPPDRYIQYSREWRALARTWARPAAMKAFMKEIQEKEGIWK